MADPAVAVSSETAPTTPEQHAAESASEPAAAEASVKDETSETAKAPEATEAPKMPDAPEVKPTVKTETKPEVKDVSAPAAMPAAPAPETECDRLAAHPFDPDAVATGVFYADLDADKVVEACQAAITDYPQEARFFTQLARGLHKAGKPSLAYAASKQGAELGSGQSMAYLGVLYKNGTSVAESQPEALAWFDKAAAAGNPGGMVFAAAMYRDGVGTDRNYERAAELYKQASDLDVAEASADLGIFYDRGQGVERNPEQAASLLLKAFAEDDKDTQRIFFEVPGVLSEATRKAVQTELKAKGFYKSSIDADFGSGTRNALILFKRDAQK
jgi:TPR repeat protein